MSDISETSNHIDALPVYAFGRYRLDPNTRQLLRDDDIVPISPKAFNTLAALIAERQRLVSKDELIHVLWPDTAVSDESLAQVIWAVRRALADDSSLPKFIATVPRRGYQFIAAVQELTNEAARISPPTPALPEARPEPSLSVPQPQGAAVSAWRYTAPVAALIAFALATALAWSVWMRPGTPGPGAPIRFSEVPPAGSVFASGGLLSPDGRYLAFVAQDVTSETTRVWVRPLSSSDMRALPGTEGATDAFWSPDSEAIGFLAGGKLKRLARSGGSAQTLAEVGPDTQGGTWGTSGTILIGHWNAGLAAVSAAGGTPRAASTVDAVSREWSHRWPQFLPDGRHFLFVVTSLNPDVAGTYVGAIDSPAKTRLFDFSVPNVTFAAPDHLLYVRDRVLIAQSFDLSQLRLTGEPAMIGGDVSGDRGLSASTTGAVAFGGVTRTHLVWFDGQGNQLGTVDAATPLSNPVLFPDQKRVLASARGLWLVDLERGATTRIVADGATPAVSPDGTDIVFSAARLGTPDIYRRAADGSTADETMLRSTESKTVQDWSPDGRFIVYVRSLPKTKMDLWLLPLSGSRTPRPFLQGPANESQARVSPDGHWVAYASDESGRSEVYLESFPEPGRKALVSPHGGTQPQWRPHANELFYLAPDQTLMSVRVNTVPQLTIEQPRPLFRMRLPANIARRRAQYAVTSEGRFLAEAIDESQDPITVLLSWANPGD